MMMSVIFLRGWNGLAVIQRSSLWGEGVNRVRDYYVIEAAPDDDFVELRRHGIGESDNIVRIVGRRSGGTWVTQGWMVRKDCVEESGGVLSPITSDSRKLFDSFKGEVTHVQEDTFRIY